MKIYVNMGKIRGIHNSPGIYTRAVDFGNMPSTRNNRKATLSIEERKGGGGGGSETKIIASSIATSSYEMNTIIGDLTLVGVNVSTEMQAPFGIQFNGNVPNNRMEIVPSKNISSGCVLKLTMFQTAGDYKKGLKLKLYLDDISSTPISIVYDCPQKRRPSVSDTSMDPNEYLYDVEYQFTDNVEKIYLGTDGNANKQFFVAYEITRP